MSLKSDLENLLVGQCYARAERFSLNNIASARMLTDAQERMSNAVRSTLARIPHTFETNIGSFITKAGDICVCLVITRTK